MNLVKRIGDAVDEDCLTIAMFAVGLGLLGAWIYFGLAAGLFLASGGLVVFVIVRIVRNMRNAP